MGNNLQLLLLPTYFWEQILNILKVFAQTILQTLTYLKLKLLPVKYWELIPNILGIYKTKCSLLSLETIRVSGDPWFLKTSVLSISVLWMCSYLFVNTKGSKNPCKIA